MRLAFCVLFAPPSTACTAHCNTWLTTRVQAEEALMKEIFGSDSDEEESEQYGGNTHALSMLSDTPQLCPQLCRVCLGCTSSRSS